VINFQATPTDLQAPVVKTQGPEIDPNPSLAEFTAAVTKFEGALTEI
jgi:hypothetical protein